MLIVAIGAQNNWFGIFGNNTTYAAGDLNITWDGVPDGDPIFVVSNMLPGDAENRDVDVENNGTAQLATLIRQETGIELTDRLLKYDGRPFYPEEIVEWVEKKAI